MNCLKDSRVESNNIARERGVTFHNFERIRLRKRKYHFDKYVTGEFVPNPDRVKELFEEYLYPVCSWLGWTTDKVKANLIFTTKMNLAAANPGSYQLYRNVSASIHPITQRIEERQEKKIVACAKNNEETR